MAYYNGNLKIKRTGTAPLFRLFSG